MLQHGKWRDICEAEVIVFKNLEVPVRHSLEDLFFQLRSCKMTPSMLIWLRSEQTDAWSRRFGGRLQDEFGGEHRQDVEALQN
jgi:hypothetical protein